MPSEPVIICNPGYGNGPYLRCTELALAVRKDLGRPFPIVMPLLYGEKQKRILCEEIGDIDIIFDETLGELITSIAYDGKNYDAFLQEWNANVDSINAKAAEHIRNTYSDVAMEVARSPLLNFGIHPAYCLLFARTSDILKQTKGNASATIRMRELEDHFAMRFVTEPGTFATHDVTDTPVPMTASLKHDDTDVQTPSMYVTASGIPKNKMVQQIILPCFTNMPERIPGSAYASPHVLRNPNIVLHIARSGWGSVWMSLLSETPLVTPPYHTGDDPEIALNNKRIVELGIGIIYAGQNAEELLRLTEPCKQRIHAYKEELLARFGTLDGAGEAARHIAAHWLKQSK